MDVSAEASVALPARLRPTPDQVCRWYEEILRSKGAEVQRVAPGQLEFTLPLSQTFFDWNPLGSLAPLSSGAIEVLDTADGFEVSLSGKARSWVTWLPLVVFALGTGGLVFLGTSTRYYLAAGAFLLLGVAWLRTKVSLGSPTRSQRLRRHRTPDRRTCRMATHSTVVAITLAISAAAAAPVASQTVQYRSQAGVEYRSQPDTGGVARAEAALAADPRNVARFIELGVAQSAVRQFREAIETFTRGLAIAPDDARLYRWRGHRYLSVRELDRALADLTRGFRIDSTNYGILYHLGVTRYALGDFAGAAEAFAHAQRRAPNAGELAGATDWLWMALSRAGRGAEAQAMLDRRPDSLPVNNAYAQRLRLYRGLIPPDSVFTAADTADVQVATLSYGIGDWFLIRGDTTQARAWFERAIRSGGWPAFGFIVAERELLRLR